MIRNYSNKDFFRLEVQPEQEFEKHIWIITGAYSIVGKNTFTYERDGEVIAIGGVETRLGINELWAMISKKCNRKDLLVLTRFAIILADKNRDARITTNMDFANATRWALILGYELKSVKECFGKVLGIFRRKQ